VATDVIEASLSPLGVAGVSVTATANTLVQLLTAAGALGGAIPAGARIVYLQPRGGDIRYADGAQSPSTGAAGLGIDIYDRVAWPYYGNLSAIKLVAVTGATPVTLAFYG
jgi:hypothetical protein